MIKKPTTPTNFYSNPITISIVGLLVALDILIDSVVYYFLWNKLILLAFPELPKFDFQIIFCFGMINAAWVYLKLLFRDCINTLITEHYVKRLEDDE